MRPRRGLIFPAIIAVIFFNHYRRLQHVRDQIASVEPEKVKATKQLCKALLKKRIKEEPAVIETSDRKCRAQLMEGKAFFIQRDLMRSFVASIDDVKTAIAKPEERKLTADFKHPLDTLKYRFDKGNSEKLRAWLGLPPIQG